MPIKQEKGKFWKADIFLLSSLYRARICKRLWSPGIDSEESISPAYVARRAGTTKRVVVPALQPENRFLGSIKGLQIRALISWLTCLQWSPSLWCTRKSYPAEKNERTLRYTLPKYCSLLTANKFNSILKINTLQRQSSSRIHRSLMGGELKVGLKGGMS